jgi:cytochrome c
MDSFEFTKIAAAVLTALLVIVGFRTLLEIREASRPHVDPKLGYTLPVAEANGAVAGKGDAPAAAFDAAKVAQAAATASADAGKEGFGKCKACHSVEPGKNGTGPSLAGVVGRKLASVPGFNYSDALKNKGGEWTPEALATFLNNPREAIPGNKMSFGGFKGDTAGLADMIAYLKTVK